MPQRNLFWPLSLLASFGFLLLLLLVGALPEPIAVAQSDCSDPAYLQQGYEACKTAQAASTGGTATVAATNTTSSGGGGQPAATAAPTLSPTRTITTTVSPRPTQAAAAPTFTPTLTRIPAVEQNNDPTPTSVLPPGVELLACAPGQTIDLAGTALPNTALLAYFAQRPVGGGLSGADGSYRISLLIGDERPGIYLVEVRERASRALVQQFGCEVPGATPTPTLVTGNTDPPTAQSSAEPTPSDTATP